MRSSLLQECPQMPVYFLQIIFFTVKSINLMVKCKILNKNIFSKHHLHVLFISFLCKMYNKKNYLRPYSSLKVMSCDVTAVVLRQAIPTIGISFKLKHQKSGHKSRYQNYLPTCNFLYILYL